MPTSPITLSALGVDAHGDPVAGAVPSAEDLNRPGFAETWTDVETHKASSARLTGDRISDTSQTPDDSATE
jgi:hypothetical protein